MPDQRSQTIKKVTIVGVMVNILLATAQITSGLLAHSQALLADGLHTLADLFSDFVVLITAQQAAKAADADHPYGHGRFETLASIFLGLLLIGVALGMGYRSIQSMIEPSSQQTEAYALLFALLAIFSKEFLYRYTIHFALKIKSTLLESNALHHRSDVFSSIVVVIGVAAQVMGMQNMDALAAIVVSVMIALMGTHLLKKAFAELIDTSLDQELVASIKQVILDMDGVMAVHSLRSRSMGGRGFIDTEIRVNPRLSVSEAHYISLNIEQIVKKQFDEISDITVHIDPVADSDHHEIQQLPSRAQLLFNLYSAWETLDDSDQIRNIHLHYLTDQVEIDVILPLDHGCDRHNSLARQIQQSVQHLDYVGKVNIYYAP
ncbi:MAG: cation diffusion facilitator family transporter [Gammaproteobacteria bacterium]|nr:cation diffusion facilitator family transporter [Gammaproteobacteria bacterium]